MPLSRLASLRQSAMNYQDEKGRIFMNKTKRVAWHKHLAKAKKTERQAPCSAENQWYRKRVNNSPLITAHSRLCES